MTTQMEKTISSIWIDLEAEEETHTQESKRKYRRLSLDKESGLRLSYLLPDKSLEMMIEIGKHAKKPDFPFPNWKGMKFDMIKLDVPEPETWHICLRLEHTEHRQVFINICSNLAEGLQHIDSPAIRKTALIDFIDRWSRFFEKYRLEGLSSEEQRGLFGELWWFKRLLNAGITSRECLDAWKGCRRAYHDFEIIGKVVEVKTTLSKEPRRVWISSERQLDNTGLISLHLLVLTLVQSEKGGKSLPDMIQELRELMSAMPSHVAEFDNSLREAGYLDAHNTLYKASYTVRMEELFKVIDGFPRIISLPTGVGDLKYSLMAGSCSDYLTNTNEYLNSVVREQYER